MKKQLRALSLCAAALASTSAFAAGTITVNDDAPFTMKQVWAQGLPSSGSWGKTAARGATGVRGGDAVYVMNHTDGTIWKFDADGSSLFCNIGTAKSAFDITADEAGNLVWNLGVGGAAAGCATFYMLPAGENDPAQIQTIEMNFPSDMTKSRVDRLGRVLGDMTSEEGAYFPIAVNAATCVVAYEVKNGACAETYTSITIPEGMAFDSGCIAQPWGLTVEESVNFDDPATATYVYSHNGNPIKSNKILGPNADLDGWEIYKSAGAGSGYGFDWFLLGDETYFIYNSKVANSGAWLNGDFVVVRASDNKVVATYAAPVDNASGQTYNSLTAWTSEDGNSVEIFAWSTVSGCAKFVIELPTETPEEHTVALAGEFNGWNTTANSTTEIVDNCATIEVSGWNSNWEFKYLVDGAWYGNGNTALVADQWYDGVDGGNMKLAADADGKVVKFTIAVDTKSFKYEIVGTAPAAAPETCCVIGRLVAGEWNPAVVAPLAKTGDYTFEAEANMSGGWFSLCEKAGEAGNWDSIGKRWGADSDGYELFNDTPARISLGSNSFNMQSFLEYPVNVKFVVDFENMTVTVSKGVSGVAGVNADSNGAVEYFNLQGVRVANPTNGLYIRRQGNTVTKVLVK